MKNIIFFLIFSFFCFNGWADDEIKEVQTGDEMKKALDKFKQMQEEINDKVKSIQEKVGGIGEFQVHVVTLNLGMNFSQINKILVTRAGLLKELNFPLQMASTVFFVITIIQKRGMLCLDWPSDFKYLNLSSI